MTKTTLRSSNLTNLDDIRAYILGGRATVTLVSAKTRTSFTYRVELKKKESRPFFFVSLLTGPENTVDYTPCGTIRRNRDLWAYRTNKSALEWARLDSPSQVGFAWFIRQLNGEGTEISDQVEVWISSHCSVCHRKLTAKPSIAAGMGPKCRANVNARLGL